MTRILVDTGPLVGLLSASDSYHATSTATFAEVSSPLFTTWPVLAETTYLLRRDAAACSALFRLVQSAALIVLPIDGQAASPWMIDFYSKYRDLIPELADASLIYIAETHGFETIFTLDRRHFHVYRLNDGRPLTVIPHVI